AKKDWREAREILRRMRDYAPLSQKDAVLKELDKIDAAMGETLRESPGGRAPPGGDGVSPKQPPGEKPGDKSGEKPGDRSDAAERNRRAEEIYRNARKAADTG